MLGKKNRGIDQRYFCKVVLGPHSICVLFVVERQKPPQPNLSAAIKWGFFTHHPSFQT